MGGIGHRILVAGEGDVGTLRTDLWEYVVDRVLGYLGPSSFDDDLWSMPSEVLRGRVPLFSSGAPAEDHWRELAPRDNDRAEATFELSYTFWDFGGAMIRSMYAWHHWTELVWATHGREIESVAEQHGFRVLDRRPSLATLVAAGHSPRFLQVPREPHDGKPRKRILLVEDEGAGSRDALRLCGDGGFMLTGEQAAAAKALDRCVCPLCVQLRPEPEFYRAWLEAVGRRRHRISYEHSDSGWLDAIGWPEVDRELCLENTLLHWLDSTEEEARASLRHDLLLDLVRLGDDGEGRVTSFARQVARGLDARALLEPHSAALSADQAYVASQALEASTAVETQPGETALALWCAQLRGSENADDVLNLLDAIAGAPELPAHPEALDDVAKVLTQPVWSGQSLEEVRAAVLLGLADMLKRVQPRGGPLRAQLVLLSGSAGEVGELARAALANLRA